jgi:hypothetical protein
VASTQPIGSFPFRNIATSQLPQSTATNSPKRHRKVQGSRGAPSQGAVRVRSPAGARGYRIALHSLRGTGPPQPPPPTRPQNLPQLGHSTGAPLPKSISSNLFKIRALTFEIRGLHPIATSLHPITLRFPRPPPSKHLPAKNSVACSDASPAAPRTHTGIGHPDPNRQSHSRGHRAPSDTVRQTPLAHPAALSPSAQRRTLPSSAPAAQLLSSAAMRSRARPPFPMPQICNSSPSPSPHPPAGVSWRSWDLHRSRDSDASKSIPSMCWIAPRIAWSRSVYCPKLSLLIEYLHAPFTQCTENATSRCTPAYVIADQDSSSKGGWESWPSLTIRSKLSPTALIRY